MNPSDITPEIIATKIFGWKYAKGKRWNNEIEPDKWVSANGHTFGELPTFLGPEWTGHLLAKAAEISKYYMLRLITNRTHEFTLWHKKKKNKSNVFDGFTNEYKELNYAIAGAILEAMEK